VAVSPTGGTFSGSGVVGNVFDPSTANLGKNVITYTYMDTNGCSASNQDSIVVVAESIPTGTTTDVSACGVDDGEILITVDNPSSNYSFSINGGPPTTDNTFTGLAPGNYTIHYVNFSLNCEWFVGPLTISNPSSPTSSIDAAIKGCINEVQDFTAMVRQFQQLDSVHTTCHFQPLEIKKWY